MAATARALLLLAAAAAAWGGTVTLTATTAGDLILSNGAQMRGDNVRSGGKGQNGIVQLPDGLMLAPGSVVSRVSFAYVYQSGYPDGGPVGTNFTVRIAGTAVYTSPDYTDYVCCQNPSNYSAPVSVDASGLAIAVPASGPPSRVEIDFHGNDRCLHLQLPISFDITCGSALCAEPPGPTTVDVTADWSGAAVNASTAATVEVDVMPFLARTQEGGPFEAYAAALSNLSAEFVRFAPWYPYPLVAVAELHPPDCTASKPATNWNSTLLDGVFHDFMTAVCGPDAAKGACTHSVVPLLSTMPDWLYQGAYPVPKGVVNPDPWEFNSFSGYNRGTALVNESCTDMAAYVARLVEHYTAGGHHDSCGHWHPSGFNYSWAAMSFLNENEHSTGGPRYTKCFDATRRAVEEVNGNIKLTGPEVVGGSYSNYFLDPKNHDDGRAPDILSHHAFLGNGGGGRAGEAWFKSADSFMSGVVASIVKQRDLVAPQTELAMAEWIPFLADWCDADDAAALFAQHGDALPRDPRAAGCPSWQDPKSKGIKPNRKTNGWNAAAANFAYAYGQLALVGYKYVTSDQLVGGPWPDNEPAVSSLDWRTGEVNAKYWAVRMLAAALGAGPKSFFQGTYAPSTASDVVFAMPYVVHATGARGVLIVSKTSDPLTVTLRGAGLAGASAQVLDGSPDGVHLDAEPGFLPPVRRTVGADGALSLAPYAVAIVDAGHDAAFTV